MLARVAEYFRKDKTEPEEPVSDDVAFSLVDEDNQTSDEAGDQTGADQIEGEQELVHLLAKWAVMSKAQRHAISALAEEITDTGKLVESNVGDLSQRFRQLAEHTGKQIEQVRGVIAISESLEVDGETIRLQEVPEILNHVLQEVISKVLYMSKQGLTLVYALDDVVGQVDDVDETVTTIEEINRQTVMLSMNAKIEAARAGEAGRGFAVVADEIKNLSNRINDLAEDIREQMSKMSTGIREGHSKLSELASMDLSDHIIGRERLEVVMSALIAQSGKMTETLAESADLNERISVDVQSVVRDMQFQDRAQQKLDNVIGALGILCGSLARIESEAIDAGSDPVADEECHDLIADIISECTLGEVKQRFARQVFFPDEIYEDEVPDEEAEDLIELF